MYFDAPGISAAIWSKSPLTSFSFAHLRMEPTPPSACCCVTPSELVSMPISGLAPPPSALDTEPGVEVEVDEQLVRAIVASSSAVTRMRRCMMNLPGSGARNLRHIGRDANRPFGVPWGCQDVFA